VNEERPDALLKSALEKIVYFEARSSQLNNEFELSKSEVDRLKSELAQAAQREIELRRVIAELEVRVTRAHAEREDAARVAEALRRERAELIGKMLEASRISGAGEASALEGLDLAQFIAELRSEVLLRRAGAKVEATLVAPPSAPTHVADVAAPRAATPSSPTFRFAGEAQPPKPTPVRSVFLGADEPLAVPAAPAAVSDSPHARPTPPVAVPSVADVAKSLKAEGRLGVSRDEYDVLTGGQGFPGRSEETLFGFSVRELSSLDATARARAADRLKALGHPAAAPAVATALHSETDPATQVALLGALATLAKIEAVPVVKPLLTAPAPDVRIGALKALLTLDPSQSGPHLAAATKDPDRTVRRRASLLALGLKGDDALRLGEDAIRDVDADVRSLAALVLGASGDDAARPLLLEAMRDKEVRVRRSASQALSRLLGRDVTDLVGLEDAQRRREVRRLAHVEAKPVRAVARPVVKQVAAPPVSAVAAYAASVAPRPAAVASPSPAAPVAAPPVRSSVAGQLAFGGPLAPAAASVRAAVAVVEEAAAPAPPSAGVTAAVLRELRAAIRGRPLADLAQGVGETQETTLRACAALVESGQVVRRGLKYFVA